MTHLEALTRQTASAAAAAAVVETHCACAGGLNNKQMHQGLAQGVDIVTGTPCMQSPQPQILITTLCWLPCLPAACWQGPARQFDACPGV